MENEVFRNIGIIGRRDSALVVETVEHLIEYLTQKGLTVVLEQEVADQIPNHGQQVGSVKMFGEICDLVVVVGGDGCMLGAARTLAKPGVPVVGVNRGNLGFLTDILPTEVERAMQAILHGEYRVEPRFLLEGQLKRDNKLVAEGDALNDIVLHPGKAVQMIEFELYIEGAFVYRQKSDGLIMATPTGSTAYSLSAGGPIMHPSLDAIALVPMFPHTLSSRPIVVNGKCEIKIVLGDMGSQVTPHVSFDGQPSLQAQSGDVLYVRKKPHKLKLIHPKDHDFYQACRSKLGWSSKITN